MRNKTKLAITCGAIILTAGICVGQGEGAKPPAEEPKYFHLDFVVKELEGRKVINARHYSTTAATADHTCTIRSGNKVPVQTGGSGPESIQFTYIEVGVNIDCRSAKEIDGSLALSVTADISTAVNAAKQPMIRQTKWSSNVIVPIGNATVIFSSDDVASKGQMQLELTATPVK
jgi:hypothetical protein